MSGLWALAGRCAGVVADLIYPRRCGGCGRFGQFFCAACRSALTPAGPHCACRRAIAPGGSCPACPAGSALAIYSAFHFEGPLRRAILALKYHGQTVLAAPLGAELSAFWLGLGQGVPDVIVPVPLHPSRRRRRGFNQAELLARPLARDLGRPIEPAIRRIRTGPAQARLGAAARRSNVQGAFGPGPVPVAGRSALLVDDVTTTGATLAAAAAALRAAGAREVAALTLAHQVQVQ